MKLSLKGAAFFVPSFKESWNDFYLCTLISRKSKMKDQKVLQIKDNIYWNGVLDHDIITFDIVMETKYGTTYNSYFIDTEKKILIDTVKESFFDEFIAKLNQVTDPSSIDYILCTHTEPDHSGSLKYLLELAPEATVIGSGQAINYLTEMVGKPFKWKKLRMVILSISATKQ